MNYSETVVWSIWTHHTLIWTHPPERVIMGFSEKLVSQNWFLGRFYQSETRAAMIKIEQYCQKGGSRGMEQWTKVISIQGSFCWVLCLTSAMAFVLLAFLVKTAGKWREFSQITELRGHFPKIKCGPGTRVGNKHRINKQKYQLPT